MGLLKNIIRFPFAWPFVLVYLCSKNKRKINLDIDAFQKVHAGKKPDNYLSAFYDEFTYFGEFRSLFYHRIGKWIKLISWIFPGQSHLGLDVPAAKLGGGVFIQHGYCTDLSAESVGEGLWLNQRVTVGWTKNGCPTIGNNVRIGTGAVIIGKVTIGDNVNIGANAIITHDVPSNCTVCPAESRIVKLNGERVDMGLKGQI